MEQLDKQQEDNSADVDINIINSSNRRSAAASTTSNNTTSRRGDPTTTTATLSAIADQDQTGGNNVDIGNPGQKDKISSISHQEQFKMRRKT